MKTGGTRALLFIGTLLLGLVLAAPCISSVIWLIISAEFIFDYLMTAELAYVAVVGVAFLLVGTFLAKRPYRLCLWASVVLVFSLALLMLFSDPPLVWGVLVLVFYNLSLVLLFIYGIKSLQ